MSLQDTLGKPTWMAENAEAIKSILPETWTHIANINALQLGFRMKLLGIDWRNENELAACMVYFHRVGLMQRDGLLFRRTS